MRRTMGTKNKRAWALAIGCVALAIGAIVLLRGHSEAKPDADPDTPPEPVTGASRLDLSGPGVSGFAAFTQGAVLANGTRQVFADVRLEAGELEGTAERPPVAMAVVLDTSGSMSGDKIAQARRAVSRVVGRMEADDRVALVVYDSDARIFQPLSRVGTVRAELLSRVESQINAGGGTNIPRALSLGQQALQSASARHVKRMVLVSDGLDGSGLSVHSVSESVQSRAERGLTTSSLGIGVDYDERFLTSVADAGRGNYEFLATGAELEGFLVRELDEATSTVVDEVVAELDLPRGWSLSNSYGGDAQRAGRTLRVPFGAMHAGERRHVLLELSVNAGAPGKTGAMPLALGYRDVTDDERHRLEPGSLALKITDEPEAVEASKDMELHAEAVAAAVDAKQAKAVEAWRQGRRDQARNMAQQNAAQLRELQAAAPSADLGGRAAEFEKDAETFADTSAESAEGKGYGLKANAKRRSRAMAY